MKTNPWSSLRTEQVPIDASEFSIGDAVILKVGNEVERRVSFLAGAYTAVLCFRAKRPCELCSRRCVEPLFTYDGEILKILPGLQQYFLDIEGILTKEQTAAFQSGVAWARENDQPEEPVTVEAPQPATTSHKEDRTEGRRPSTRQDQRHRRPEGAANSRVMFSEEKP